MLWIGIALLQTLGPGRFAAVKSPAPGNSLMQAQRQGREGEKTYLTFLLVLAIPASAACVSPISRAWHCDGDSFGAGTGGSPERFMGAASGWQPLTTARVVVWSLPPRPCCSRGEWPQGSLAMDVFAWEPIAGSCLLVDTFAVYRKNTSGSDLRDTGEKPILATPKNPLARMQPSAWGPLGMVSPCFCSSCSIPPIRLATNQCCFRLPGGMPAAFIFSELIFSTVSLLTALAACRAARRAGGLQLHCPPQPCLSGSCIATLALLASPRAQHPADCSMCG